MRNLSQKQKEAVQKVLTLQTINIAWIGILKLLCFFFQLRLKVADLNLDDERNSDDYLVRWLIAQDMSFQKAEEMLRNVRKDIDK